MGLLTGKVSLGTQNLFDGPMETKWYPGDPADRWKKPKIIGPGILGKNLGGDGCGVGYHKNAAGNCVPDDTTDLVCPAGQTKNAAGVCVSGECQYGKCADGSCKDSDGNCGTTCQYGKCPDGRCKTSSTDNCGGAGCSYGKCPDGSCKQSVNDTCVVTKTCATHGGANTCGEWGNCYPPPCQTGDCPNPAHVRDASGVCGPKKCIYGMDEWGNCIDPTQGNCQYGRYIDGRCKPKPLGEGLPGVGITVDGNIQQAPLSHYMEGLVDPKTGETIQRGDPRAYLGADPNWAGGIDYPMSWQSTNLGTEYDDRGILSSGASKIYENNPALLAAQEAVMEMMREPGFGMDEEIARQGLLASAGVGVSPAVSTEQKESANKANDSVKAAENAQNKADESVSRAERSGSDADKKAADADKRAADKAKRKADKDIADAQNKADADAIKAAAEASRKAEADREARLAAKVAEDLAKNKRDAQLAQIFADQAKWQAEADAREQALIAAMGYDHGASDTCPAGQSRDANGNCISTANIWS